MTAPDSAAGPARPPAYRLVHTDLPPEARARAWLDMTSAAHDAALTDIAPEGMAWEVEGLILGAITLGYTHLAGAVVTADRTAERIARDGLDVIRVMHILAGASRRRTDTAEFAVPPGDILFTDMARPERAVGQGQTALVLVMPRAALAHAEADLDHLHGLVLRAGTPGHALLAAHIDALWRSRAAIAAEDVARLSAAATGLVASLVLGPAPARWSAALRDGAAVTRVMRHIRAHLADADLSPARLGRDFAISRANLYRAFEPLGGVARYVRGQRLKAALALLTDDRAGARTIAEIAAAVGFADPAVFNRAFRRRYGLSPREARRRALAGQGVAGLAAAGEGRDHMTIPAWIEAMA